MTPIVRTKFELPTYYMDGLRPKKPKNNEFVESESKNWALVNQTNTGKKGEEEKKKKTKIDSRIELVIGLMSNIKEQTSSDFVEDNIFNTTFFLFILLSSESFPVFV